MVTMRLRTGLLIEYFLRFVRLMTFVFEARLPTVCSVKSHILLNNSAS